MIFGSVICINLARQAHSSLHMFTPNCHSSLLILHSSLLTPHVYEKKVFTVDLNQSKYVAIQLYIIFTNTYSITQDKSFTIIFPNSTSILNNNLLQIRATIWLWWSYLLCLYFEILARFQYTTIPQVSTNKVRLTQSIHAFPYMFLFQV